MRFRYVIAAATMLVAQTTVVTGQALPARNGRTVVATINEDAITLDEFARQLGPAADRARLRQGRATARELELLERLVTIKLIAQEADATGLADMPEVQRQVDVTSREILREMVLERLVKHVRPDPALVEKRYRESVREWKTSSLLFQDQTAAERARKEIAGGAAFAAVAARAVAAKTARTEGDGAYHPRKDYLPAIAETLATLSPGQVSPVIRIQAGFVVLRVLDIRYPQNADARADARRAVLNQRQQAVLKAHEEASKHKYVVLNTSLLKSLDYEAAKPGTEVLLKDKRIVAEIKGGVSVTVSDLTDYLRMQFFHGSNQAKQGKEMNERKAGALDAMIGRRLLNAEAVRLGLDKTHEYRDRVQGYRESLVFDRFIQQVIAPENKLKEDELKQYYAAHLKDYSYPEMVKLRSLAFTSRAAAEGAIRKLREGADYGWLASNAGGQVAKGTPGVLTFESRPVTTETMPEGVRKALAGAKAGEHRLYASPEGHVHVLTLQELIASTAKPYDEVREAAAKTLYGEKLKKGVEDYAKKLKAHSKVATYLKRMA